MFNTSYIAELSFWFHQRLTKDHGLLLNVIRQENTMITFCTLKMCPLCIFMNHYITSKQPMKIVEN